MNTRILIFMLAAGVAFSASSVPVQAQGAQGAKKAVAALGKQATQNGRQIPQSRGLV